jgi:VWFA-related protein
MFPTRYRTATLIGAVAWLGIAAAIRAQDPQGAQDGFRFTSGVELVNVTATVTDGRGRFIDALDQDDFVVYENGKRQEVSHFTAGTVPVSLGIALDVSASMTPEKIAAARAAINRFVFDLLHPEDELFFMKFSSEPKITQDWTMDRRAIARAVEMVETSGGTAIYDAVAHALPVAAGGRHRKKAILVISDGNDTNSDVTPRELRNLIRDTDVLVYALGVDGTTRESPVTRRPPDRPSSPVPPSPMPPFPWPGAGRGRQRFPPIFGGGSTPSVAPGDRVDGDALRQMTDDTGGRTEIVRGFSGLEDATRRLADELSKQYYLGYSSTEPRDGLWHPIRVEIRERKLQVRARRGFVAS